jgi:AbrB family looped-hinge helix DNA binding protein
MYYKDATIMEKFHTTVTRKGQVTIPVEIRHELGIDEGDKVTWSLEDGYVRLERSDSVVARTAGMLKSDLPPRTPAELREAAAQAIAEDVVESLRG